MISKFKMKHIFSGCLLASAFITPIQTSAGNPLEEVFGMMTTSAGPNAFESSKRNGVAFGTFSARFSMYTPKIVNFEPPSLSVGCGGIDFFAGSISLVKKEELVQMGRAVAAGAAVYAFNLAVEAICPTCSQAMQAIQEKLEKFNELLSADCQDVVDGLSKVQFGKDQAASLRDNVNVYGWQNKLGSMAETKTDSHGNWVDLLTERSNTGNSSDAPGAGILGNTIWNSFKEAGVKDWSFVAGFSKEEMQMMLMSLTGTQVVHEKGGKIVWQTIPKTLEIDDLIHASSKKVKMLTCKENTKCLEFVNDDGSEKNWSGLYHQIYKRIMGDGGTDPGIAQKIPRKADLNSDEIAFVNSAPIHIMDMLFHLSRTPEAQASVAEMLAQSMAIRAVDDMVYELEKILKVARDASESSMESNASNVAYLENRIEELNNQRAKVKQKFKEEMGNPQDIIDKYETLKAAAQKMTSYGVY